MGNVKHAFTSPKADGGDATLVRPSNWNAAHEGAVEILDRDLSQIDVVNDAAETSIYSFSIPADAMGATGGARLTIAGDCLNDSGGARTLGIRVKLGGTTILTTPDFQIGVGTDRREWNLTVLLLNSAVAAQKWSALFAMSDDAPEDFFVHGSGVTAGDITGTGYTSSSKDTSGALVLEVTVDWNVAHASASMRKEMALLELIPAI